MGWAKKGRSKEGTEGRNIGKEKREAEVTGEDLVRRGEGRRGWNTLCFLDFCYTFVRCIGLL